MDFESYDVLVVGGGLAGIRAAIAVVESNPRLKVGMVSTGPERDQAMWIEDPATF